MHLNLLWWLLPLALAVFLALRATGLRPLPIVWLGVLTIALAAGLIRYTADQPAPDAAERAFASVESVIHDTGYDWTLHYVMATCAVPLGVAYYLLLLGVAWTLAQRRRR